MPRLCHKLQGLEKVIYEISHSKYRKNGDKAFVLNKKGGSYNINLSPQQEEKLLAEFSDKGDAIHIPEVSQIKNKYEKLAGNSIHKSGVYRMLTRHGWRKTAPRTSHPKNDQLAMLLLKKLPR